MSRGKVTGAQFCQKPGGEGDRLMGEIEIMITVCQVTRLQDRM